MLSLLQYSRETDLSLTKARQEGRQNLFAVYPDMRVRMEVVRQWRHEGIMIIIIEVFIKHKILSIETILSAYTYTCIHTGAHTHMHACTHSHALTHTSHMHALAHNTHAHAHTHTTRTHARMHARTHTHTHTLTHSPGVICRYEG